MHVGTSTRILLIEDDRHVTNLIRRYLMQHECDVEVADCVCEAKRSQIGNVFDVVVVDLYLKDGGYGLDVVNWMRGTDRDAPVVVITGSASIDELVRSLRVGASFYLRKPFLPQDLKEVIDALVSRSGNAKQAYKGSQAQVCLGCLRDPLMVQLAPLVQSSMLSTLAKRVLLTAVNAVPPCQTIIGISHRLEVSPKLLYRGISFNYLNNTPSWSLLDLLRAIVTYRTICHAQHCRSLKAACAEFYVQRSALERTSKKLYNRTFAALASDGGATAGKRISIHIQTITRLEK